MCKLPSRCQHSLRCARFGQHLDDKFSFRGPREYAGVAGLIYERRNRSRAEEVQYLWGRLQYGSYRGARVTVGVHGGT